MSRTYGGVPHHVTTLKATKNNVAVGNCPFEQYISFVNGALKRNENITSIEMIFNYYNVHLKLSMISDFKLLQFEGSGNGLRRTFSIIRRATRGNCYTATESIFKQSHETLKAINC